MSKNDCGLAPVVTWRDLSRLGRKLVRTVLGAAAATAGLALMFLPA